MDFEALLSEFGNMVYRIAFTHMRSKEDAEDVMQDVFIKLLTCNREFDSNEDVKFWLIRVTINRCNGILKSLKIRRSISYDDALEVEAPEKEDREDVYRAVLSLPLKYRDPIFLFYYSDLSIMRISEALGRNESTVKTQLARGRSLLKEMLKGDYDYEI